jgi:calcium-dependent protein kinase
VQDPKKRATADAILQHSWMKENGTASDKPLDNVILTRMRGFTNMNKLKKEALKVIAAGMSPEEIAGLRSIFQVGLFYLVSLANKGFCTVYCCF